MMTTASQRNYLYMENSNPAAYGRHNESANFGFADGHAKWVRVQEALRTDSVGRRFWGCPSPRNPG